MTTVVPFTHKGWFGFCPIYAAEVDCESPRLEPRIPFTEWMIYVAAWIYDTLGAEAYPIMFTGELSPAKAIAVD